MVIFISKNSKKKKKGFLLTEAILSLFVLTIGLVSVVALISSSLRDSFYSRDTIVAIQLSQEGAELVRNVRDNGFLNNASNPFYKFDSSKKHCAIDYNVIVSNPLNCFSTKASSYALNYSGGFYQHSVGTNTRFSRYVYVEYNGTDRAVVRSFVYWGAPTDGIPIFVIADVGSSGSITGCVASKKCVFTEITLTNWR